MLFEVEPDIAVFGKAISNGYPMGIILGKSDVMQAAQDSFISSTYWTECIGPVASINTIRFYCENKVNEHLISVGKRVQEGWIELAKKNNLEIEVGGILPLSHFSFKYKEPLVLKSLYTQFMLEHGFLATTALYVSFAHKKEHIDKYLKATDLAFEFISKAIIEGDPKKYLKGPVCHSGFKRLN
jgi:glutamate-1-semialdehyde aminotransferase